MFIDVHCHLDLLEKEGIKAEKAIENAKKNNVGIMLIQGVNPESNRKVLKIADLSETINSCLGMYPIDSLDLTEKEIEEEVKFIKKNKDIVFGIGEIGLDLKFDSKEKNFETQKNTFIKFVNLGKELNKTIIVHSRKAELETIEILEELKSKKVIMHCFSGKLKLAERIVKNDWFISIPTCVKHSEHFQKIIEKTPIENLLCETDSPYLHPDKKFPNQPANVIESYKKIAQIKNKPLKEIEKLIEKNYNSLK
jgi:TatD DNase family protein